MKEDTTEYGVYDMCGEYVRWEKEYATNDMRELSEAEQKDISYLVDDKYVSFFTNPNSDCEGTTTGYLGSWNYPKIMEEFRQHVINATKAIYDYDLFSKKKNVWAEMREKYYDGKPYVFAEDMIEEHLKDFDNREIIAALHYCVVYKERYCDGICGYYAKEGYIGQLLLKLKELPLSLS